MILRSFIFISLFSFLFITPIYAADNWCIQDPENLPCNGVPGECTINSNGSLGGFVAETATVELVIINGLKRNKPFIGLHTSICETAQVTGNAWIYGNAWVYGAAQVYGSAQITGDAQVFGHARVYGDTYVCGDAQIFGTTLVSTGSYGF